ncbi:HNH endonuclease [Gordonia lacunae]|uniref:HNH endonuclease n=1 Tax=Gordonia TaxID=2053 RepID=UPI00200A4C35|nr:HNH endonuclease [Gordonia terrae]UPW12025.1 HNH endonuclease [Gordonia terrae]
MATAHHLTVDADRDAREVARFTRFCVAGPPGSCTIFVGAIGDDGYGRFWLGRRPGPAVVRAQRFAYAMVHGEIPAMVVAMHECDNPLCVAVGRGHVVAGTQADNLAHMAGKHRGGGSGAGRGTTGLDRQARRARAHALRAAVIDGWDSDRVREALGLSMPGQESLFAWNELEGTS